MKQLYLYILCLLLGLALHAEKGPKVRSGKTAVKEGSVQFRFNNLAPASAAKDSVLIIFDRCNRTGAGVVYQVYKADDDRNITIDGIPAGKYFVTIQGLGIHHDRAETIVTIKASKSRHLAVSLEDSEEFSKDTVVIPPSDTDFASLSIVSMK